MPACDSVDWITFAGFSVLVPAAKVSVTLAPPAACTRLFAFSRSNWYGYW